MVRVLLLHTFSTLLTTPDRPVKVLHKMRTPGHLSDRQKDENENMSEKNELTELIRLTIKKYLTLQML